MVKTVDTVLSKHENGDPFHGRMHSTYGVTSWGKRFFIFVKNKGAPFATTHPLTVYIRAHARAGARTHTRTILHGNLIVNI